MLGRGCKEAFLPQRARREKDLAPCVISALLPCRYPHGHNDRESGRRRGKGSRRVSQPSVFLLSLRLREVLLLLRFQQHTVGAAQFDIHTVIIFSAGQHHKRVGKRNDTGDQQKRKGALLTANEKALRRSKNEKTYDGIVFRRAAAPEPDCLRKSDFSGGSSPVTEKKFSTLLPFLREAWYNSLS